MDADRVNTASDDRLVLSEENVLMLWSKTYNTDGKPDWSHIFKYYHEEIVFHDSIQRTGGKEGFIALCNRLTGRCKQLKMDIESIFKKENEIIFDWKMTMMLKKISKYAHIRLHEIDFA